MRKAVLLFLIAALLLGGGYYVWMSARPAPAPSGSVPMPHATSNPAPERDADPRPEKVVPLPAPFTRPAPKPVPQEAQQPIAQPSALPRARPNAPSSAARQEAAQGPAIYRSLDELVLVTLDEALGRPAAYKLFFSRSDPPWHYLCGQPLEQDKSPFEYARSRLKAQNENGQTEDMFCLLASASRGGFEMKEVSIGAPDNPMAGWAEAHPAAQALILGRRQP